jgi:hypothetical protein
MESNRVECEMKKKKKQKIKETRIDVRHLTLENLEQLSFCSFFRRGCEAPAGALWRCQANGASFHQIDSIITNNNNNNNNNKQ